MEIDRLTEREIKHEFSELWTLLSATFHADWRDDFVLARDALDDSLGGYTTWGMRMIHRQISQLLAVLRGDSDVSLFAVSGADLRIGPEMGMTDRNFASMLWSLTDLDSSEATSAD